MPAKKYENFKRTENNFFQKGRFSMNEKIQMHQKQRFLKQLYIDLKNKDIVLKIAEARSEVRDILRAENLEDLLGHISRFISVDDLVVQATSNV